MATIAQGIFEQFMQVKFSHVKPEDPYYTEWKSRFDNGMEWQKSDYASRAALKAIAPHIYPDDKDKFFIRE